MDEHTGIGTFRAGETLELVQPSARRREYELRRAGRAVGWLRFPPGRRSVALAEGAGTGAFVLTARPGRVEVRRGPDAAVIATVELARGGSAVIRMLDAPELGWQRSGWRHWAVADANATLLRFTTAHGVVRASARIAVQRELPEPAGVVLGLLGGFLALRKLQAEVDGAAAIGGIVAAGAG
jgi:hypothetical protein